MFNWASMGSWIGRKKTVPSWMGYYRGSALDCVPGQESGCPGTWGVLCNRSHSELSTTQTFENCSDNFCHKWFIVCGHLSRNAKVNVLSGLSSKRACNPSECKCTNTSSFTWLYHGFYFPFYFCLCLRNVPSWETDGSLCNHLKVY